MSTFCGLIEEIPGISVDRFNDDNLKSTVFFLSHCHTDHMQGLNANFFQQLQQRQQFIYCTPISKAILISNPYNNLGNPQSHICIKTIDGFSPIVINYKTNFNSTEDSYLTVTCIPAGHCPGSVMFIFENSTTCVLYTGDFRIDENDLPKIKPLHDNYANKYKPKFFNNIYLDTTFFKSKFEFFPNRQLCLKEICKVIKDWIEKTRENIVILECSGNYGPEHLFIELAQQLNIQIHVKDVVYKSYTLIPELVDCITNDPKATQIHACMTKSQYKYSECLPCNGEIKLKSERVITVVPSVYRWKDYDLRRNICEWDSRENRFYACYSCHASRGELIEFIKYFKPQKLYPCVVPKDVDLSTLQEELNEFLKKDDVNGGCYVWDLSKYKATRTNKSKTLSLSDDDDDDC